MSTIEPESPTPLEPQLPSPPDETPLVPDTQAGAVTAEDRQWGMIAHLSALAGGVITGGWGHSLACFVGPLVVWQLKKDSMPFVNDQGKEALNFNITVGIVFLALTIFTVMTFGIGILILWPAYLVVAFGWLVLSMVAAYKAYHGIAYRYPVCLRLIK